MERLTERHDHGIKMAAGYDFGIDPDDYDLVQKILAKLADYEDMDEQGRLVVLPCKVGDWVYALWDVPTAAKYVIYCAEVKEIRIANRNCRLTTTYLLEPIEYRGRRKEYRDDDIGKTVFLTREEAERALEGQKDG